MTDKTSFAKWVHDHATTAALDPQAPLDDLEPLRAVIGDARVVAIGESAHYVREFYRHCDVPRIAELSREGNYLLGNRHGSPSTGSWGQACH